ncbi:uncharacterized protein BO72DRAFT_502874, partial [Aspergillus fijiensis CBS 313.89]
LPQPPPLHIPLPRLHHPRRPLQPPQITHPARLRQKRLLVVLPADPGPPRRPTPLHVHVGHVQRPQRLEGVRVARHQILDPVARVRAAYQRLHGPRQVVVEPAQARLVDHRHARPVRGAVLARPRPAVRVHAGRVRGEVVQVREEDGVAGGAHRGAGAGEVVVEGG